LATPTCVMYRPNNKPYAIRPMLAIEQAPS
jgi:hypothetical protein